MAKATTTKENPRLSFFKNDLVKKPALHKTFEKLYEDKKGDWPAINKALQKNKSFSAAVVKNLAFTHELANWTSDNKTLVTVFQNNKDTNSMRDIALTTNKKEFKKLITGAAIPKGETKTAYADKLYNELYAKEPTAVVVSMINDPKVPLLNNDNGKYIAELLSKTPEFNIKTTSVYELIKKKDFLKGLPENKKKEITTELKTLQRITLISPVPEAVPVLINKNYGSGYSITQLPLVQFIATLDGTELPEETLTHIYTEAENRKIINEQTLIKIKEVGERTGIRIIDGDLPVKGNKHVPDRIDPEVKDLLTRNNLSWDLLFGDADFCECSECTSVYSAAAYYVDLLQYLRNNNLDSKTVKLNSTDISGTPLQKLFARRPDLGHLELTCQNTNTILPYVDLVNEVMEQYVAYKTTNAFNVADETSGELLSAPQHTEQEHAYQTLKEAVFPFTLPYHQPIDAARIFLNHLNSSRYELLSTILSARDSENAMEPTKEGGEITISPITYNTLPFENAELDRLYEDYLQRSFDAEFLNLISEEYFALTKEVFVSKEYWDTQFFVGGSHGIHTIDEYQNKIGIIPLEKYYGYDSKADMLSLEETKKLGLTFVKEQFLPRAGIAYTDLIELLKTQYINPPSTSGAISIVGGPIVLANTGACNLDEVRLSAGTSQLAESRYDKIHRFIRLWRKLDFTIDETDKAIMALGSGNITPGLIHQLVAVKKIMNHSGIELTKLLCFWGDIGTKGDNSLYQSLFLSHNLLAMDAIFKANSTGGYLTVTPIVKISDHLPAVMAALNLSADDIAAIKAYITIPDELTITNLSILYRYRLLSKTLGLRVPAFVKLLPVFGDVFKDADATLQFLESWNKTEEAGFTAEQLNYIITGTDNDKKPFAPSKKEVLVLAKKIYDGLNSIELEHADLTADNSAITDAQKQQSIKDKATAELVRSKASLLYDAEMVEKTISILEGATLYKTEAPANLNPAFPANLLKKTKYQTTATTGSLQVTGALTDTELMQLKTLSTNTTWQKAVEDIRKQQNTLFKEIMSGIFTASPTEETIVKAENSDTSAPAKRLAFLKVFLPYLRAQLKNKLVINALSEQPGLDKNIVQTLAVNILKNEDYSLYQNLASIEKLPVTVTPPPTPNWNGKLIPLADGEYTFIVKNYTNPSSKIIIDDVALQQSTTLPATPNEWWSAEVKLESGKVFQFSVEGVNLEDIYWKTKTSAIGYIPNTVLLPDFKIEGTGAALEKLKKMAMLINGYSLSADELNYLHGNKDFDSFNFNALLPIPLDFNDLKLKPFLRIADYCSLRNSLPQPRTNILDFWKWINDSTTPETDLNQKIAELTLWKIEDVGKLISSGHFNLSKKDLKNEQNLLKLQRALAVASKIGMDINTLFKWALPTSDFETCKIIADSVQKAIRAQYNQTDWEQVVKPFNDQLRNNQKNALIAYLLQQPELKAARVPDADGLFEYFLIDVQMDTCMETSRIKQAISSVQLFIQRCFLGLEEDILPSLLDRQRWEWMERYRVWEANRKIFLYPENWIESNLRDDKSPFFKELESELLQKDINKQNVTDALKTYLYKVDEVANMEGVGLYIEGEKVNYSTWDKGAKLHVFSRTRNAPYFFYYRYLALDEMNWYPWEKMQVDIPSYDVEDDNGQIRGNGCYLTPVVWNGRLLVFFPQFMKKTKPNPNASGTIESLAKGLQSNLKPIEYWEIKMAWSEYKNGKWTQKQLSADALSIDLSPLDKYSRQIDDFLFILKQTENNLIIAIDDAVNDDGIATGAFVFDGNRLGQDYDDKSKKIPKKIPIGHTFINASFSFQNLISGTTAGFKRIQSFQAFRKIPSNNEWNWKYYDDFAVYKNPERVLIFNYSTQLFKFYLSFSVDLLKNINSAYLENFFKFNLSIGTSIDDAFGNSLDSARNKIYHELKRPYSLYNWELFFHTPIMIADALSKAQQFEEAMKWFHYVFNPIGDGSDDKRFWQFAPFKEINSKNILEQIFNSLKADTQNAAISEWRNNPFKPHLVARSRPVAYMKWVVMKYIDNILDWGDYLFRQDTIESINQATQLYVLAVHILGRKPMMIPKRGETKIQTYLSLLDKWDAFSNAMSELEVAAIYSIQTVKNTGTKMKATATADVFGSVSALYFCLPKNPKLLGYWDTLADRLFKIRHCQNIEGVFRMLPLFEPAIDPALLVKAAAQGLSISSVVNDLNTAMPNYRFYYLLQKSLELCNELKSLGGAMLSAIEKKDNETMSLIRARHEGTMNNLMMEIKKLQLEESQKSLESLYQNRKAPEARMKYYLQLTGEDANKLPGIDGDFAELANSIEKPIDESGLRLSKFEKEDMDKANLSAILQLSAGIPEALASILYVIPMLAADVKPFGLGAGASFGGTNLGQLTQAVSKGLQIAASHLSHQSSIAAKKGGFQRALQERIMQANAAGYELKQIDKQITTQQIRINITNQEILNQQKQIDNTNEIEEFLKNKYTNEELYTWMRGSLKTLYHQVYNLAYDLAKKAEKTYCFERGVSNSGFIQSGYFDAGREGLLAGEQLYVGLKQLEAAYQEKRGYDYEITKHISLRQLDPLALLQLKAACISEFDLPEVLFDMDYPGHFKRRIKSVSVSVPCIAGPYTGVNATLRLLNNKFRNSSIANNYPEKTDEQDDRFISYNIPITAIATSSAQNDAGMFELNFKDERYLPFEGAGVISKWRLELPTVKQFDYNTISDVVLHLKYIASEGGEQLKESAKGTVAEQLNLISQQLNETGLHIPISLKHDMPNEWNLLVKTGTANITIDKSRLPYMAHNPSIDHLILISNVKIEKFRCFHNTEVDINFDQIVGIDNLYKSNEIKNVSLDAKFDIYGYKTEQKHGTTAPPVIMEDVVDNTELKLLDDLVMVIKYHIT